MKRIGERTEVRVGGNVLVFRSTGQVPPAPGEREVRRRRFRHLRGELHVRLGLADLADLEAVEALLDSRGVPEAG